MVCQWGVVACGHVCCEPSRNMKHSSALAVGFQVAWTSRDVPCPAAKETVSWSIAIGGRVVVASESDEILSHAVASIPLGVASAILEATSSWTETMRHHSECLLRVGRALRRCCPGQPVESNARCIRVRHGRHLRQRRNRAQRSACDYPGQGEAKS